MKEENNKKKWIEEICREKGIEKIDISYDWISILKKGNVHKKLVNGNFYLNTKISSELAKDKYSTYELLRYYDLPIIEHAVLFNEKMMPNVESINGDYEILKNTKKQVIKANDSLQGKDVYVSEIENEKRQIVKEIFEKEIPAVVVCPYLEVEYEYRAIFLAGEIIYLYKKQKPFVVGDGKSNIRELIEKQLKYLEEPDSNLDFQKILNQDEKVMVGWKHNLSNGAIPLFVDENDVYAEKIKTIAKKAGNVLGLTFASVDVVVTKDKEISIMEVNSKVCIKKFCELMPNGYEIGKEIYRKVIDKIFEE